MSISLAVIYNINRKSLIIWLRRLGGNREVKFVSDCATSYTLDTNMVIAPNDHHDWMRTRYSSQNHDLLPSSRSRSSLRYSNEKPDEICTLVGI
jgi:hypothetical protein